MMKFSRNLAWTLILFLILFLFPIQVFADDTNELDRQLREKQQQIAEVQAQLNEVQGQEKTLKTQLSVIDNQTKLTNLKIDETNFKITKLNKEIADLDGRLTRISTTVDQLSEVLLNMIVKTYKYSNTTPLELMLSSNGFGDMLRKVKYIETVQSEEKKYLYQLQATKSLYNDQKNDKQTRQTEAEELKKELEKYQADLVSQKKAKEDLLKVTQNDEKRYQELLAKLKADADSLARALSSGGVKLGSVGRGEKIAVVGNSGCSTGPHLHFEVITPAKIVNGKIVDEGGGTIGWGLDHRVDPRPYINSGKLAKPVGEYTDNDSCSQDSAPPPYCHYGDISTRFGQTYIMGTHTGLDIVDYMGAPIYAADSGDSYAFSDTQPCSKYTNTVGKGVAVDHHNGVVTLYWHIP